MRRDEALAVLGMTGEPDGPQLRRAYRALLRRHHPDVAGPAAQDRTVRIIQAYAVLAGSPPAETDRTEPTGAATTAGGAGTAGGATTAGTTDGAERGAADLAGAAHAGADDDTLEVDLPPDEAFLLLVDVAQRYGEVTYIDRETGLFETVLEFEGHGPCSVVTTLQGRATGVTEAFLCCEPLIPSRPGPAISDITTWFRRVIAARAGAT